MYLDPKYVTDYASNFVKVFVEYSKLISAFLILFIGLYAIRIINRLIKSNDQEGLDLTLTFLSDILLWVLRVLLFVTFISKLE
jgi:small conductance mechanosensitive channel